MPKTNSKKGGGNVTKVDPYTVEVHQALTALNLLESPENGTVFLSICTLDTYVSKYGKTGLSYLQENDLLGKLFINLVKPKMIRTMCLKILIQLIQLDGIMTKIRTNLDYTKIIITIFMTTVDQVEIEYTIYLLSPICKVTSCAELLCQDNIINKLFETLVTQMDVEMKNNCLEIILGLVNCHQMKQMLSETPSFRIKVLNLFLEGPFFVLRPIIVEILSKVSYWEYDSMKVQLFESEAISYLFDILSEANWTTVQDSALITIYNCLKTHPVQIKSLESKNFLAFVNFARNSDLEHAMACIALIETFVTEKGNRQVLCDLGIHKVLSDFCKFDDDIIGIKYCNTITEFCKNCHLIKELANPVVIKEIEKLMNKSTLSWDPYKETGLQPLYLFIMNNPHLKTVFYQTNVLKHILNAMLHRDKLDHVNYKMILEIYQYMFGSRCLHKYMLSPVIFSQLLSLLNDCDTEFIKIGIDVIQRTFYSQEYRQWFLEFEGVEYIVSMLCKRNCSYLDQAIAFCKFASKYDDICFALLKNGLIPILHHLGNIAAHRKPICDTIINDIYNCDLAIKFHDTWFLDYEDVIKGSFYIYVGYKPRIFPPREVDELQKLSLTSTVVTVNFDGKHHETVPVEVANKEVKETESAQSEAESASEIQSVDDSDVITNFNLEDNEEDDCIRRLSFSDKDPSTDNYLKTYLKEAQRLVNLKENEATHRKIIVLARFVMTQLSGHDGKLPTKHHYVTHILELKKKLLTNYIPLGYIRIGSMIERALLFKVLADRLGIPATFRRTSDFCAWNEVSVYNISPNCLTKNLQYNFMQHYVVDLMRDPETLLPIGQKNTEYYYKKSQKYAALFEEDDATASTSVLPSSSSDS